MSFSFALSESRRLFLRSPSVRSLASAVSEPRQFFVACEDCTARFALSLLWRLDNRVSSSSALSEARRIFLVSSGGCCNFMRVLSLNWNYGMCSARYIEKSLPDVRLGWLAPARQLDNAQTQRLRACCYTVSKYVEELHSSGMAPRTARARSVHIGHVV